MALRPWRELAAEIAALGAPVAGIDEVSALSASGRILAKPVRALRALPPETHAVMDGFALGSAPPGRYRLVEPRPTRLCLDEAAPISAGDPAPIGAAAVALAARALRDGDHVTVPDARQKDNIRRAGEEAVSGVAILAPGTRLDARHLALAAAAGVSAFAVRRRPRVALLALHEGAEVLPHATVLAALLDSPALAADGPLTLRASRLSAEIRRLAPSHDLVVVVAESLDADDGPLARAIHECGGKVRIGRAALKPAKPIVFGRIDGATVVGFAGTAYAAAVAAHLFLRPVLRRLAGLAVDDPLLAAAADFSRERAPGRAEALPALLSRSDFGLCVVMAGRFGQLSALAAMDGFALVDAEASDIAPGFPLLYHPLRMPLI